MSPGTVWLFVFLAFYWAYGTYWAVDASYRAGTAQGFFIASRGLPWWVFVLAATGMSAGGLTYMILPSLVYRDGFQALYIAYGAIAMGLAGAFFMKRQWIVGLRFGFETQAGMLGAHYNSEALRLFSAFMALVFAIPFAGLHLFATGMLVETVTGGAVGRIPAMWVLSAVLFLHIVLGGMRAVAFAGSLQTVLGFAGILAIGSAAYVEIGGFGPWADALGRLGTSTLGVWGMGSDGANALFSVPGVVQFTAGLGQQAPAGGPWTSAMILSFMLALMGLVASPGMTALVFSCRSPRAFALQQVWGSAGALGLLILFFVSVMGLGAYLLGASTEATAEGLTGVQLLPAMAAGSEQLTGQYILNLAAEAPWFLGLLTLCAIAALQVAAAVHLSAASAVAAKDLYARYFRPDLDDAAMKRAARIALFFIIMAAALIATFSTPLLTQSGALALAFGAQLMFALAGVCWFPWLSREGVVTGLGGGLLAATLTDNFGISLLHYAGLDLPWGRWPWTIHSAGWGLAVNLALCLLISWATYRRRTQNRRQAIHSYFTALELLPLAKLRLRPVAWGIVIVWIFLGVGPGAIVGNDIFGSAAGGREAWATGVPSIFAWQIVWWLVGMLVIWFLAYKMDFSTIPSTRIEPAAAAEAAFAHQPAPAHAALAWLWPALLFLAGLTAINWAFR